MKEHEFIELLNLYLDHEIGPEDAARLELEVRSDARRRAVYQQYCRMQKACSLFAAGNEAPAPAGLARRMKPVSQPRLVWINPLWSGALLAGAAACLLALLVVHRRSGVSGASATAASIKAAVPHDEFAAAPAELTTVFSTHPALPAGGSRGTDGLVTVALVQTGQLDWLAQARSGQNAFVQTMDLSLTQPSVEAPVDTILSEPKSAPSLAVPTEMTAFEIAK